MTAFVATADDDLRRMQGIAAEYDREYDDAVLTAAVQVWASIQRHNGDPRWEYRYAPAWPINGEVCA